MAAAAVEALLRGWNDLCLGTRCRFCNSPAKSSTAPNVCDSAECLKRAQEACAKTLHCGHFCFGAKDEAECLPCLVKGCAAHCAAAAAGKLPQTGCDMCTICHVEELNAAPCIQLACTHVFHRHCLLQILEKRWWTMRISFGFLNCPICKTEMKAPGNPEISKTLGELNEFRQDLRRRARPRLEYEGRHTDAAITDPTKPFKNDRTMYAEYLLNYYECSKCKKPYFGGIRTCDVLTGADAADEFPVGELVCGGCAFAATSGGNKPPQTNGPCAKHGSAFLAFKCRYCCSGAVWLCGGATHWCEPCHANSGAVQSRTSHPQCGGRDRCPLGVDHPPNPAEYCLGCVVCNGIKGC